MILSHDITAPDLMTRVHALREASQGNPRVHPNGFIQLDLDTVEDNWHDSHKQGHSGGMRRLHIWNPPGFELPRQGTVNEIHDHVFDMRSNVVRGVLAQQLYLFIVGDTRVTHELYRAVYQKNSDSRLEAMGVSGWLANKSTEVIGSGESYVQPAFTLHDSNPGGSLVVTVMEKLKVHEGEATVVCPVDTKPDNSFDRASAAPTDYLWRAIMASLA